MTTITTGVFFVRQKPAQATTSADGFSLVLYVVDNQGPMVIGATRIAPRKETYEVKWNGDDARAWWGKHGPLKPGAALRLILENPRTFPGELGQPETRARVRSCELLPPRAPATSNPVQQPNAAHA
ncbi:MAG: hypothetical protein EOO29_11485 [Comamonadaceae bacterium]|nr:MAG: hypothetical protein EOO29_11485 [Comamonadaceae bacterium]